MWYRKTQQLMHSIGLLIIVLRSSVYYQSFRLETWKEENLKENNVQPVIAYGSPVCYSNTLQGIRGIKLKLTDRTLKEKQ